MVDICKYELPTSLQNFTQKDLTEVKIFQNVLGGGGTFFETTFTSTRICFRILEKSIHLLN